MASWKYEEKILFALKKHMWHGAARNAGGSIVRHGGNNKSAWRKARSKSARALDNQHASLAP